MRAIFDDAAHTDTFEGLLARLNDESTGALVFKSPHAMEIPESYEPLVPDDLAEFAERPRGKALELGMGSRLSLAGAQSKLGLFHKGADANVGWFAPKGSAPSNFIVKAVDGTFPHQTINEALCLLTARNLGLESANAQLIDVGTPDPLIAVQRFDRANGEGERPTRLHEEDFCQALGWPSRRKYEPTDGNYAAIMAELVDRESSNPFGDRAFLFNCLLFDWMIGNCDNHLNNWSFVYSPDWTRRTVSPLYDVTCTTYYPALDAEMGVSVRASRRYDDARMEDIIDTAKAMGLPKKLAVSEFETLRDGFQNAIEEASETISGQGFSDVQLIAEHIIASFNKRANRL